MKKGKLIKILKNQKSKLHIYNISLFYIKSSECPPTHQHFLIKSYQKTKSKNGYKKLITAFGYPSVFNKKGLSTSNNDSATVLICSPQLVSCSTIKMWFSKL